MREAAITDCEDLQDDLSLLENCEIENDSGDQVYSFSWTSVLGNRATNEFKVSHVRENLLQGGLFAFGGGCAAPPCDDYAFTGLGGRDQFDIGSANEHEDYVAGPSASVQQDKIRTYGFENAFTFIKSGWGGDHTFKAGFGFSKNSADPQEIGGNQIGTFEFLHNLNFVEWNASTYPSVFSIRLGADDLPAGRRALQLLLPGQVAGESPADPESRPEIRQAGSGGHEQRVRATPRRRLRPEW